MADGMGKQLHHSGYVSPDIVGQSASVPAAKHPLDNSQRVKPSIMNIYFDLITKGWILIPFQIKLPHTGVKWKISL